MTEWLTEFVNALYSYPLSKLKQRVKMLENRREQRLKSPKPSRFNDMIIKKIEEELNILRMVIYDREISDRIT